MVTSLGGGDSREAWHSATSLNLFEIRRKNAFAHVPLFSEDRDKEKAMDKHKHVKGGRKEIWFFRVCFALHFTFF